MEYSRGTGEKLILIIDDSEDDVLFLKRVLTRSSIINPVHWVSSGKEAMAYLDGTGHYADRQQWPSPAIIMLDLTLPGVSGFEFLEWCRGHKHCKKTVIVVLSGSGEVPTIRRAYQLGANS